MLFGVPTMYHRLAADLEASAALAAAVGGARLLVSGSAALPAADHERISRRLRAAARRALRDERDADEHGDPRRRRPPAGHGRRAAGRASRVRLVDDAGAELDVSDDETVGEIQVRGPNLFLEYLNRPDATAEAMRDGWFATGDVATRAEDGYIRIVGRRATDLIKSGGYKIGAGEIENALLEHPAVAEAAVTGEPDDDLGERIVAWVVVEGVRAAGRARAGRPRRASAHPAQAPARGALPGRAPAQRHGQGHQGDAGLVNAVKSGALRGRPPWGMQGRRTFLIAAVVALVASAATRRHRRPAPARRRAPRALRGPRRARGRAPTASTRSSGRPTPSGASRCGVQAELTALLATCDARARRPRDAGGAQGAAAVRTSSTATGR